MSAFLTPHFKYTCQLNLYCTLIDHHKQGLPYAQASFLFLYIVTITSTMQILMVFRSGYFQKNLQITGWQNNILNEHCYTTAEACRVDRMVHRYRHHYSHWGYSYVFIVVIDFYSIVVVIVSVTTIASNAVIVIIVNIVVCLGADIFVVKVIITVLVIFHIVAVIVLVFIYYHSCRHRYRNCFQCYCSRSSYLYCNIIIVIIVLINIVIVFIVIFLSSSLFLMRSLLLSI